jgi:hypothetical protein
MTQVKVKFDIKTLPTEVTTLICSFGYPEYKEYMNEICYQLTHYTGTGLLQYNLYLLEEDFLSLYRMNYVRCMTEFLAYAVDEEILQNLFKQCTKCCCCSKHGHNRPTNYYTDDVSIGENLEEMCHCKCRSLSRNIKRVTMYKENYKKSKKCRRKSTFNIQFISSSFLILQSSQTLHHHAQCHLANQPTLP